MTPLRSEVALDSIEIAKDRRSWAVTRGAVSAGAAIVMLVLGSMLYDALPASIDIVACIVCFVSAVAFYSLSLAFAWIAGCAHTTVKWYSKQIERGDG